jgi:cell division septation protein DedD
MDEVLARRLLGATAILAVAFLFASLLPEPEDKRGDDIVAAYDLSTGLPIGPTVAEQAPVEHPPALKSDDTLAGPEAQDAPPDAAEPPPQAEPLPRPALRVDEHLASRSGGWFVQVGSFSNQANARGALQKLFGMGLPTVIQSVSVGKTLWYRVRVGPYPAEAPAAAALAKIKKNGFNSAKLVSPDSDAAPKGN